MASLGDRARAAREIAQRRINAMKEQIKSGLYTKAQKESLQANIKQLQRDMRQTRMYTKTGKRIGNRTAEAREAAINRLNEITKTQATIREVRTQIRELRTSITQRNKITQQQLNMASLKSTQEAEKAGAQVGKYTTEQVKRFYNATQKYWEGVEEHKRNEAILKGLNIVSLEEAVAYVLAQTGKEAEVIRKVREGVSYDDMSEEEQEIYNKLASGDSSDAPQPSPPYEQVQPMQ